MKTHLKRHTVLTELLDALSIGVALINTENHTVEFLNKAGARITYCNPEEIVGKECQGFVCGAWNGVCPIKRSGIKPYEEEQILVTGDNQKIPVLRTAKSITIDNTVYVAEIFHDLSKLKDSLQELAIRDTMLEGLAKAINILVTGLDRVDAAVEDSLAVLGFACNLDAAYIFQFYSNVKNKVLAPPTLRYRWSNFSQMEFERLDSAQSAPQFDCKGRTAQLLLDLKKGNIVRITEEDLPEEEKTWFDSLWIHSCMCAPIYTKEGLWGFLTFSTNKSDNRWKSAVQSIVLSAAESFGGALSVKRTEEQLQTEVRKAEKLALSAKEASRYKSDFLASMSHEIRTPLNGLLGFLNLLAETGLSGEQSEYLQDAQTSADSLMTLINDVLDFSKIEAGKVEIERTPFSPLSVVEETGITLQPLARSRDNELNLCIGGDVPKEVVGDPARYRQILMNLGGNAVKFTEEGRVSIEVLVEEESEKQVFLTTHVRDTGIGIEADMLEQLFDPFRQGKQSTNRRYGGTGLGLSISRHLTVLMGGELRCESEPGKGSHFWFTLPFKKTKSNMVKPKPLFSGEKVSVLCGNPDVSRTLSRYIAEWGGNVVISDGDTLFQNNRDEAAVHLIDCPLKQQDCVKKIKEYIDRDWTKGAPKIVFLIDAENQKEVQTVPDPDRCSSVAKPIRKNQLYKSLAGLLKVTIDYDSSTKSSQAMDSEKVAEKNVRVLIAEDNRINQKLTAKLLEKRGYQWEIAANGKEAVEMYESGTFDLILMDCQMPEVDGYMATLRIRKREQEAKGDEADGRKRIPIIALTAHAFKGEEQKVKAAGMDDYLSKPTDPQKLIGKIEYWLTKSGVLS